MKNLSMLLIILAISFSSIKAQPTTSPSQPSKKEILKPVANVKPYPELNQFLYLDSWKADVWWVTEKAGHSSTIPEIRFTLNKEAIWQSPFQEIVSPTPGSFTIDGKNLSFSFKYTPYKYVFTGVYDIYTGKISGNFTQTRMKHLNAPDGYFPGTTSGTFTMSKK